MKLHSLFSVVVVFLVYNMLPSVKGNDIRCYSCNSYINRSCSDPMDPHVTTTVCLSGYVCTKVSYSTGGIKVTSRSCDPGRNTCNQIENTLKGYYVDLTSFRCNTCTKNLCNSASRSKESILFALPLLILVLTFL